MDARTERLRRLRCRAAAWWVWAFVGVVGILLTTAGASGYRATVRARAICVLLELTPDDSWQASAFWSEDRPRERAAYPPDGSGCIVEVFGRGSQHGNGLGLYRRSFLWGLYDAGVSELPVQWKPTAFGQVPESWKPDILPREAHRAIVHAIERDVFGSASRRDAAATLLWDDPEFDPLFTTWTERRSGWNRAEFLRELRDDTIIAICFASLIALTRFALPLVIRRFPPGCCASCGYDLAGLAPSGVQGDVTCPECGAASTLDEKN